MSTARSVAFETGHEEIIHDVQLDYYGKRLATCSSDRTIRIFDASTTPPALLCTLPAHDGPVWQIAWAHPRFGSLLASGSYDGRVLVWKEVQNGQWIKCCEWFHHEVSVNSVAFAPHNFGLSLAAACSDGTLWIYTRIESSGAWDVQKVMAHAGGVNAVSWGPDIASGALLNPTAPTRVDKRLVTGGCDNHIRIWKQSEDGHWQEENFTSKPQHKDWVRDVAWAPLLGLPSNTIASASEDKTVCLWYEQEGEWICGATLPFESGVWRVSWSVNGNLLAVAQGDQKVSLWKEGTDGTWQTVSTVVSES